jgi:FKBP-type peptidyl-prolyl cis-trans isomerase
MNALLVCAAALLGGAPVPAAPAASVVRSAPQDPATKQDPAGKQDPAKSAGIPDCQDMKKTASGLEIGFLQKGSEGSSPAPSDYVEVHYTGWLTDGTKFDSSRDRGEPTTFAVGGVIKGWTEGLQLMTPGARCKLVIPSALAYGERGAPPQIPANATLVFDVELLRVVTPKAEVVTAGTGDVCGKADAVELKYTIKDKEGKVLQSSEKAGRPIRSAIDSLDPFLQTIVGHKVGSVLKLEVSKAILPRAGSDTVWELEIVKVLAVPKFRELDRAKTVTTQSGLQYEVIEQGKGESPKASDTVSAHYTGWLLDGTVFDSSHARGEPSEFPLNGVIKGWTEGLQLMQVGGKYLFSIPGDLAYGASGRPPKIGANATLVFLVELVAVKKQ